MNESLLFQDPVVCRFTESNNQCSVALGQQRHLQIPLVDGFNLRFTDKTFTDRNILKYRKTQSNPPTPNIPGWQFVNDNKTLILTSAERNNSGTYTVEIFDADGKSKGNSTLQLNIEGLSY
ncbi:carcinoembryonic antigen-related cell adhesion molecule 5-like isoform X1 [Clarias magur]|uniref:Carcinoembryonic antigen-related cell adhesion molecule 5-like isoform X1 n=1 Tax=Clarias magur TaxID=1594786 RepID=A0A8J4UCX4_CLAMG|nr:carcinoembryonic antigen-related cell adhesion molecule 5-like isoform X1 [Clarias magur]